MEEKKVLKIIDELKQIHVNEDIGFSASNNDYSIKIIAAKNNFHFDEIVGLKFNLFFKKWSKSNDTSVNYISTFLKN